MPKIETEKVIERTQKLLKVLQEESKVQHAIFEAEQGEKKGSAQLKLMINATCIKALLYTLTGVVLEDTV
jgi:hypothetical protein